MSYPEPPHCFSCTRCPTKSHLTVWAIPDVLPWATLLFQLYQMSYHEPLHCLSYTRCPTNHHICHSQGEFHGTSVGWCKLRSGGQIVAALVICDWLVFWVRCSLASKLLYTYSQSGYWSKSHSENRNRPDKWRPTTKCNQLLYLLECKMRFLLEIWCLNMWGSSNS